MFSIVNIRKIERRTVASVAITALAKSILCFLRLYVNGLLFEDATVVYVN